MPIRGTLPVIPTPFIDGVIDYPSLQRLLEFFLPVVDGYTLAGSTGEAPSLTLQERMDLLEFTMQHTPAGKTVVVGIAHTSVGSAIELAQHAEAHGAQGCLIPSPYYFFNTRDGVYEFIRQIDAHVGLDLVFYDNPYNSKTAWSVTDLAWLGLEIPHLRSVKVTDHAIEKIAWLKQNTDLTVLAGDDVVLYRSLLLGADGCMVIAPAVCPGPFQEAWNLLRAGRQAESYALFCRRVLPFVHMFGVGSEIGVTKALYRHLGIFTTDEMRPPLTRCDDSFRDQVILAYETCRAL